MSDQELKRHPVRGGIWGIPTGLGLGLLAVNSQIFSLSLTTLGAFAVLGIIIGAAWASFGPAKKPKGAAPDPRASAAEPEPVASATHSTGPMEDETRDQTPGEQPGPI